MKIKQRRSMSRTVSKDFWNYAVYALVLGAGMTLCFVSPAFSAETWDEKNKEAIESYQEGDYKEAAEDAQDALATAEREYGPSAAETSLALNNLALIYKKQGKYDEAIKLYQRSLAIGEQIVGPDDDDLLVTLSNLAMLYEQKGDSVNADAIYKRVRNSGHDEWAKKMEDRAKEIRS